MWPKHGIFLNFIGLAHSQMTKAGVQSDNSTSFYTKNRAIDAGIMHSSTT